MILPKSLIKRRSKTGAPMPDLWVPPDLNTRKLPKINAPEVATRAMYWIQNMCCIVDGPLQDSPFLMLGWQWRVMWQLFGTLKDDGYRQYKHVYIQIPKKNVKSQWMSCLALYCLSADGEKGATVICGAKDREQGKHVGDPAMYMAKKINEWGKKRVFRVYQSPRSILYPMTNGKMLFATGEVTGKQGAGPSALFLDEVSEWPGGAGGKGEMLYRTHTSYSQRARKQPLIFTATTANVLVEGSIYQTLKRQAIDAAANPEKYPDLLPVLYLPTSKDIEYLKKKPPTKSMLKRLNPAIPRVISLENEYLEAKKAWHSKDPSKRQDLDRFVLNIDISSVNKWMPPDVWHPCNQGPIDEAELEGRRCFVGMDLSTGGQHGGDLSAVVFIFPPEGKKEKTKIICRFYLPINRILKHSGQMEGENIRRDAADYSQWEKDGWLTSTPGDFVAHSEILADVAAMSKKFDIQKIAFDPFKASEIVQGLVKGHGFAAHNLIAVKNTPKNFNECLGAFMEAALKKDINHAGNPILAFCFDNLQVKTGQDGLKRPEKELLHRSARIDGAIATLLAWQVLYTERKRWENVPKEALVIR